MSIVDCGKKKIAGSVGGRWNAGVSERDLATGVLRGVSRSFYLSLRLLPPVLRDTVSVAYLLARASDTLADTGNVAVATRLDLLRRFAARVESGAGDPAFRRDMEQSFLPAQRDVAERVLLERTEDCLAWLGQLDGGHAGCVREVVATITGGQVLDLERFGGATREAPVALAGDDELEDYAWRVAGCVGKFWTDLGFLAFGDRYARRSREEMVKLGVAYGKGLQMVNILRDTEADLRQGRCYLPAVGAGDRAALAVAWRRWLAKARPWLEDGLSYASAVRPWRMRVATALPARLGVRTLELLEQVGEPPRDKVKVSRWVVWRELAGAMMARGQDLLGEKSRGRIPRLRPGSE